MEGKIHWRENNAIGEDILKNMLRKKWKEDDARN